MCAKALPFSAADFKQAKALLEKKQVKNLLFSEGTYQVEITETKPKASYFPFLQISDEGKLDCFCSCGSGEEALCPILRQQSSSFVRVQCRSICGSVKASGISSVSWRATDMVMR
jgi:hypothetical protein